MCSLWQSPHCFTSYLHKVKCHLTFFILLSLPTECCWLSLHFRSPQLFSSHWKWINWDLPHYELDGPTYSLLFDTVGVFLTSCLILVCFHQGQVALNYSFSFLSLSFFSSIKWRHIDMVHISWHLAGCSQLKCDFSLSTMNSLHRFDLIKADWTGELCWYQASWICLSTVIVRQTSRWSFYTFFVLFMTWTRSGQVLL